MTFFPKFTVFSFFLTQISHFPPQSSYKNFLARWYLSRYSVILCHWYKKAFKENNHLEFKLLYKVKHWTARRSNQSILKISPGISLEGMMLKLKLQYFGHLMRRVDLLEKTLVLGGIGGRRRRERQRMRWLDDITDFMEWVWVNSGSWWCTGRPGVLRFMGSQRVRYDWATELTN